MLEQIILGMVFNNDLTGYDIKKYIENGIGVFYRASYGSLYPALKKLTDKGYLTLFEEPRGGRKKIFYRITEDGKTVFLDWLTSPINILDGTNAHLARVYFFDKLPTEARERQLMEYEMNNVVYLRKLVALEKEFNQIENKDCFYYKLSTLYYGICVTRETIRWCKHIREEKPLSALCKEEAQS